MPGPVAFAKPGSASKEKRAGGPPLPQHGAFAGSTMAPAASEPSRYPRGRSRVYLFPDRPQVREHRPDGRPVPFLRSPGSLQASSRVVTGRAAHFRTRGVKTDAKPTLGLPKGAPGVAVSTAFAVTAAVAALGMDQPASVSRTSLDGEVAGPGRQAWLGPSVRRPS